jgi:hypothetical protein
MVEAVSDMIGARYQSLLPQVRPFMPDQQFQQDFARLAGGNFLTPDARRQFVDAINENVLSRMQGGAIDGDIYHQISSELARLGRQYRSSSAMPERELGRVFDGVRDAFRDLLTRTQPADVSGGLRAVDEAYAGLVRLQGAASSPAAVGGVFTAPQLAHAVRSGDNTGRRAAYARGDAFMQDLSDASRSILPSTVPNSGSVDRALAAALLTGTAGGTAIGLINPYAAGAAALGMGAYSRPGANLLARALMAQRPQAVQSFWRALMPAGGGFAVPLNSYLLSPPDPPRAQ